LGPADFTLVEDRSRGVIVSSLCLISQVWSYDGVDFRVGQVEMVGTDPGYRRRGLVRAQFEAIHRRSARRGHQVQAIVGIPYFYRQFGYEMALEYGGGRIGYRADVPNPGKARGEPYRVRAATAADVSFIGKVYREGMKRYLVSCARSPELWRREVDMRRDRVITRRLQLCVIESAASEPVGILVYSTDLWEDKTLGAFVYELRPAVSWLSVTPSVIRHLLAAGQKHANRQRKRLACLAFWFGSEHPAYQVVPSLLARSREPYAFYLRVGDLPGFVRHIAPVLERRLAESVAVGYTGELRLDFYRDGLRLAFERGRLVAAESWAPAEGRSAAFPNLTFLQLLFGHRSLDELHVAYRDCFAHDDEARLLLSVLFPKKPSSVWTVR
jgi:hypothetical protein